MGLRLRLVLLLLVPMTTVVAGYAFLRVTEGRAQIREEFDRRVSITSAAIRLVVAHEMRTGKLVEVERLARELVVKQTEIVRVRLLDRDLGVRVDANLLSGDPGVPLDRFRAVRDSGETALVEHWRGGIRLHSVLLPVPGTDGDVLEVVHVAGRLEADLITENQRAAVRGVLLVVVLGLVVWLALQRVVLRPIADLTHGLDQVGAGAPRATVPVRSRDEFGQVASAFNRMTERLEEARQRAEAETARSLELMRRLRQTESLAIAGKLCSSIAHEVGTPLNIIAGRAELMLPGLPPESPLREDLAVIIDQIDRISRMIRAALDPFRPHDPERVPTELATVTTALGPLLRHFARSRGVTLATRVSRDLPPVLVDPGHLQQVLINLITNAIAATPAGGRVDVAATTRAAEERAGVAIEVRDTGSGIPEEIVPRIFDPFFSTKPDSSGTGLGLSICRDLVRANGSDVGVTSVVGEGTTFTVWLPEARKDQP